MPRGFAHFIGATVDFTTIGEQPLSIGEWSPIDELSLAIVDWTTFFEGSGLSTLLTANWRPPPESQGQPILGVLVQIISAVFGASRQLQKAPSLTAAAEQLDEMRDAAARLADLARGGDGEGWSGAPPAWLGLGAEGKQSAGCGHGVEQFEAPTAAIHPQLQRLIADAVYLRNLEPGGHDAVPAANAHADMLRLTRVLFEDLGAMIASLDAARLLAESNAVSLDSAPRRGAPRDNARNWALIRLMWIYRDAVGEAPTIYAKKTRPREELATPEPQGCMRFVVDAMAHVEPIKPHQLLALERKLSEFLAAIPASRLFATVSRGNSAKP